MGDVIPLPPARFYTVRPGEQDASGTLLPVRYEGTPRGLIAAEKHAVALTAGGGRQYIELAEGRPLMARIIREILNGRSTRIIRPSAYPAARPDPATIRQRYEPPPKKPVRKRKGPHYAEPAWPGVL